MYTFNNFCYGIDVNALIETTTDFPLWVLEEVFEGIIIGTDTNPKIKFEINREYHGGCDQDYFPGYIGFLIACDDMNKNYINEIRKADEKFYKKLWYDTLSKVLNELKSEDDLLKKEYSEDEYKNIIYIINLIENTEPHFFSFEASS